MSGLFQEAEFYRKTGQDDDHKFTYEGYSSDGETDPKTGVALPFFTKETAEEIANDLLASGRVMVYDKEEEAFQYVDAKEHVHVFKGEDIKVEPGVGLTPGVKVHAYPIGRGVLPDFAWTEVVKSWIYVTRAICPYCGDEFGEVRNECESCGREVDF
jgi:hypothetical protein